MRINNTLKKLSLTNNKVGDEGATALAFSLKLNHSLKYLYLDHNSEITEQTMQYIASIMSNLDLRMKSIDAEIKKHSLSRSLRHSMNLENIDEVFDLNPTDDVSKPFFIILIIIYLHCIYNSL